MISLCFGRMCGQTIEGEVYNAVTSKVIENATVVNLNSEVVAASNHNGKFQINVERLPVTLHVSALGFEEQQLEVTSFDRNLTVYLSPSSEKLSEVVIRSTLIPKRITKIPTSLNVISKSDFQRNDAVNLVQNFNNSVPGVYVNQGALNTNKINIRGIGARSQYSTNRIQTYFDGIPLSTAEGESTLDDIDQETLERVEILKGPNSSIYGAGLGGVINLYSARPAAEETSASVKSQFGSFNTLKKSIMASHGGNNSQLFANYTHLKSDGYRENGNYDRKSMLLNARLLTGENNSLSFLTNFTRLKAFIPSSINEENFLNNPETANGNWADSRGYESYDRGLMGVSYEHHFSEKFKNTTSVYVSFRDAYEPRPFDILKEERVSAGARTRFNANVSVLDLPSEISFGGEIYNEWYETGTFENLFREFEGRGSVLGERLSNNEQDRNYRNFFAQFNMEFSERWNIETGFNLNSTNYSLTDLYVQDEVDQTGDYQFKTIFSPRIGAIYEVGQNKNLYASISHGFSTPTVAETLTPEGQINTSLEPETGFNYELGFKGNWLKNRLYTEFSLYSIQIENLLVAQRVAQDQYVGINAGKTNHNGFELLANYNFQFTESISAKPYINAAFNFFEFDEFIHDDEDNSGNKLPGVPNSTLNIGLDIFSESGFTFYSHFQAVGEIPLNDANSVYTDDYKLLNLKAGYNLDLIGNFKANFNMGINNVFDEHYAASVLPNAVGFGGAAPRYYYPGNPRNYFGGVGLSYIF